MGTGVEIGWRIGSKFVQMEVANNERRMEGLSGVVEKEEWVLRFER
jgi:hypothetical protein